MSDVFGAILNTLAGTVVLGDMVFVEFAGPAQISDGGAQQMTVHKLPGGQRVIDTMGDDPAPIGWSGTFLGPLVELQAAQLRAMQQAGDPIPLSWGIEDHTVVITSVAFQRSFHRIEYRIECTVLPDPDPDDDPDEDADGPGDGDPPDTPQTQQVEGQAKVSAARSATASIPIPPIPPS